MSSTVPWTRRTVAFGPAAASSGPSGQPVVDGSSSRLAESGLADRRVASGGDHVDLDGDPGYRPDGEADGLKRAQASGASRRDIRLEEATDLLIAIAKINRMVATISARSSTSASTVHAGRPTSCAARTVHGGSVIGSNRAPLATRPLRANDSDPTVRVRGGVGTAGGVGAWVVVCVGVRRCSSRWSASGGWRCLRIRAGRRW
jgi:hypothetical protein